ncbi:1,4-alpha-glucan branching protein GlgB [Deinococcus roseus]|uniref:1,4-alpha-glucan branching enzyme GlgB n=1 Tax=Deinococcus roseus TaxID=392414 RepID=A0ABQ2D7Z5_9DEIO|nr:1,4-alpha-glucan branching protein GlgB [Deinococcus roseus]GGJ49292.1 1,4-alpha-glucan branching enzyme GlgB [Deinococcus roseus]
MTDLELLQQGRHYDPFRFLGLHFDGDRGNLRTWSPPAKSIEAVFPSGKTYALTQLDPSGLFEATGIEQEENASAYLLRITYQDGNVQDIRDPYSFWPVLSDFDLSLIKIGEQHQLHKKLGANVIEHQGVKGVSFAVWAPNAERVSVVGNFNGWNGLQNPMRTLGESGIWEIFLPFIGHGEYYKFEIRSREGHVFLKSDPLAKFSEMRPGTASIVYDLTQFSWTDSGWVQNRQEDTRKDPISIYEVHLGSWMVGENGEFINYRQLADKLADYVLDLGYTHVELLPINEHPFDGSWGYQVTGYFAPTSRFGTPDDFKHFMNHMHEKGIGVIIDWVPGHFPKDAHSLGRFDGTPIYEYADPRKGEHLDWGTYIFDYGRTEVVNFLLSSALFWIEEYHVDGLRVDAVASILYLDFSRPHDAWIPNIYGGNENLEAIHFLKRLNELTHQYHPGILTMAEESSAFAGVSRPVYAGGLGFDYKWGMGWMNDSLAYFEKESVYRKFEHHKISFFMVYAYHENYVLPISHDEVVHGKKSLLDKMPGDKWQKHANHRAFLAYMWTMPGKKLLFQGQEFGQWQEWSEARSLDWNLTEYPEHKGTQLLIRDLNHLYRHQKALHTSDCIPGGFQWINVSDSDNSVFSYIRKDLDSDDQVIVVANFTPVERSGYRIGVPAAGAYRELLNSDAEVYGGSNRGNLGLVYSQDQPYNGFHDSLEIMIPALGVIILKKED